MKISLLLRTIPAVMAVLTAVTIGVFYQANEHERDILLMQSELRFLGNELMETSDFLTEQARSYVQYGEKRYLEAYVQESGNTRTRDRVMARLESIKAPQLEIELLGQARRLSYKLEEMERSAFDLVAAGRLEEARRMLFSEEYHRGKQPIVEALNKFQQAINERSRNEAAQAIRDSQKALLVAISSTLAVIIAVFIGAAIMNSKISDMNAMGALARNMAEGQLNVDISRYRSRDEFGLLAVSLGDMSATVKGMDDEIARLIKSVEAGNLADRADASRFKGDWARILNGLNDLLLRASASMRRNQSDLQRIIDSLPLAIIIQDPLDWKVDYANAPFFRLMEISPDARLQDIDVHALHSSEQADGIPLADKEQEIIGVAEGQGETKSLEFTYTSAGGQTIDAMLTINAIDYGGKKRLIKMIQDISAEKQANQLLKSAAEREREANMLKSRFLANMSHEIRTPMNAIIGLTQIALTREQDPPNVDSYRKINSSAKNLLSILNDILDFSKIEAQKMDLVESEFSLEDILANALMVAMGRIDEKHIEVLLDLAPEAPCNLVGDKTRLWQILKNLLDNSAKYTEKGRVVLNVSVARRESDKVYLDFKVSDSGIGMSPEQVDSLYSPFQQFSADFKSRTTGTGLGMSITKQLLELMGGTISVSSKVGAGTEITVNIGFKLPPGETVTMEQAVSRNKREECRVLIADDDPQSCEIMERLLKVVGLVPVCVLSGAEALKTAAEYAAAGTPFQLVILDYLLGADNGIAVANEMAKYADNCKFLMVSAYVKRIPRKEVKAAGFKDVLQKPFVPSVFIRTLFEALDDQYTSFSLEHKTFAKVDVLLCEDNELNREVATGMLKILGIEPDVAENGRECLDMMEKKRYDLVLMDIMMPVMDGKEAIRRIRASDKPWKNVCIMAMTANAMLDQVDELMALGADGHIPKPIELETLEKRLAERLPYATAAEAAAAMVEKRLDPVPAGSLAALEGAGVAVGDGLKRFVGDEKNYKRALRRFADEYQPPENPAAADDIQRLLHTMRGVAGNLGAYELAALAKEAEDDILRGEPRPGSYGKLRSMFDEMAGRIRAVC